MKQIKNAYIKDCLRQVKATFHRFAAIVIITALGVAFFAGLRATGPDMRQTAEQYLNEQNFMDFRLVSTVGFTEADVQAAETEGVKEVTPLYSLDALAKLPGENLTVHLYSINSGEGEVNAPLLTAGRMPEKSTEALADRQFLERSGLAVGDTVALATGSDEPLDETLAGSVYTIVGAVESPLYISTERGSATVGSGKADAFLLLPREAFLYEVYTELYVTLQNPEGLSRFGANYEQLLQPVEAALEKTGQARAALRYSEIKTEAETQLANARRQVEEGEQKLADGEAELKAARQELDDGWKSYRQGQAEFDSQIAEANRQLSDGNAAWQAGQTQYEQGLAQYEAGLAQLQQGRQQLAAGEEEYNAGQQGYAAALSLQEGLQQALSGGPTPENIAIIAAGAQALQQQNPPLAAALQAYADSPADAGALLAAEAALQQFAAGLEQTRLELAAAGAKLEASRQTLQQTQAQLDAALQTLQSSKAQLDAAKAQLNAGAAELQRQQAEGAATLQAALQKLRQGEAEYQSGLATFEEQRQTAQQQLQTARRDIADGEQQLAELEAPKWYVLNHDTNIGFVGYKQDTDRVEALGIVVPVLFFLVAALVTMTSMTRLVDSDRSYIGTLKALGYGNKKIALRYLLYAVAASALGGLAGLAVGFTLFPKMIFEAYASLYTLPPIQLSFVAPLAVFSLAAAVGCAALPAFLCACARCGKCPPS
ncbi:MAG: FtsX-like permease family protein [Oscillospiraceae bacterium]